ncbi:sensor histidine kinase [Marinifilum sp.]|uniref:sensor histidine kinase n=1 Tax=Marinifilum sp. TaxID=2033137 RepID=UPI003BA8D9EE
MTKLLYLHKCTLLVFFLIIAANTLAQRTDFLIHEHSKKNNLSNELVKSTCQDSIGIHYFATDGGVYSLVNDNFNLYQLPEGKSRYFKKLLKLSSGKLLAISDDAIYNIDPSLESNNIELIIECNSDLSAPRYPKHAFEDSKKRIWITDFNHIYRLNNGTLEKYSMSSRNLTSSYARSFQFLECDNGKLIVVSQKGWFYNYDSKTNSFVESNYQLGLLVHSSFKIGPNEFLLGTSNGIEKIIFDFKGQVVHTEIISKDILASCFEKIDENRVLAGTWFQGLVEVELNEEHKFYHVGGFPYYTINDIFQDDYGKYWVSTNTGVIVMEKKFFSSQFLKPNAEYVASMVRTPCGGLLCAGRSHLFKIVKENQIENIDISFEGSLNVFKQYGEYTLIGTEQGQLLLYLKNELLKSIQIGSQSITHIEFESLGTVWVVSDKELFKVNLEDGTKKSYIEDFDKYKIAQSLCMTKKGTLYIGGEYKHSYLFRYDRESDKCVNINQKIPANGLNDIWVRDLESIEDTIFIASSVGLYKYYDSKVELVDLGEYSNNEISAIEIDQYNSIWITTSKGVIRKRKEDISLFNSDQGLPSKTFTIGNLLIDDNGFLWVGTSNGLAYARIKNSIPRTPKPIVHIAKEESQFIKPNRFLEVNTGSMLLLDVTATIYPQKQNKFQYCIVKGSKKITDWKELSNKNQVIVSDMPPGDYKVCIRCKHEGNYAWSEHRIIPLRVNQVWYLRWYTLLSALIVILLIVYFSSEYSKQRAQKYMIELEKQVSERTVQLQDANQNLLMANKAKDRFLSIIGHDLRNPFNAIRGFSNMLLHDAEMLSEKEKIELTEMIYKSSDDTFKLLESLLEWANVQKGNLKLNREEFNLAEVMQSNLELHRNLASLKDVRVEGNFKDLQVNADKAMIDTIIRNLLSNAIKYSYANQTILLRATQKEDYAVVQVKDEGIGMTENQVNQLFKIDTVLTSEGTSNETGTGFGLLLSKEFVEMNGGQIRVSSVKGKGTSFYFSIPLKKA